MPDEPDKAAKPEITPPADPSVSPAPTEIVEPSAGTPTTEPESGGGPPLSADALPDGTVPTVLNSNTKKPKESPVKAEKSKLNAVYRRADIITTLLTFVGTIVASSLIVGGYLYFTQSKKVEPPKVTTLDQAELDKMSGFLAGGDASTSTQVLTVSSSSMFKNRVAIASDLKVTGSLEVGGLSTLSDLTVNKTSSLGATNIRGSLNVSGPTILQSPALLNGGASISGTLSATGNASFGGSISAGTINAKDISVTGNLNLAGHIVISGQNPSAEPASEAGVGATARVEGNDSAGTVTINTGILTPTVKSLGGLLVTVNFKTPYGKVPRVLITPIGSSTGNLPFYVLKTNRGFTIGQNQNAVNSTAYSFDYWVIE